MDKAILGYPCFETQVLRMSKIFDSKFNAIKTVKYSNKYYQVYRVFRLDLGNSRNMINFESLLNLISLEASNILISSNGMSLKPHHHNIVFGSGYVNCLNWSQVKIVQIPETHVH